MNFRPLHDRVVVRRLDGEAKTAGGIIIPDTAQEKPMEGEIVAAGPGARDDSGKAGLPWMSRPATACCLANGPALKSKLMVRIS